MAEGASAGLIWSGRVRNSLGVTACTAVMMRSSTSGANLVGRS